MSTFDEEDDLEVERGLAVLDSKEHARASDFGSVGEMMATSMLGCLLFVGFFAAVLASAPPSPAEYELARSELVASGAVIGLNAFPLSEAEKAADGALQSRILEEKKRALATLGGAVIQRNFLDVLPFIESSPFLSVVKSMPKGAVLHAHSGSNVPFPWVIANLSYLPNVYYHVKNDSAANPFGSMRFFRNAPSSDWMLLSDVRAQQPNVTEFDQKLVESISIIKSYNGTDTQIWAAFAETFLVMDGLIKYDGVFPQYLNKMFELFYEDGVHHLDFRMMLGFNDVYDIDGNIYNASTKLHMTKAALSLFQETHPNFTISVIFCSLRSPDVDVASALKLAYTLRDDFPGFLVGFDLVGQEDLGASLHHWVPSILAVEQAMFARDPHTVPMPFYFHAGETDRASLDGTEVDANILDALMLNTTRIGHGYALMKNPLLVARVLQQNVTLSVCPISNQVLGLVRDLRNHPAVQMIRAGVRVTLSPDDPASWGVYGVSYDWYEALMGWDLNLGGVKAMLLNAIEGAAMDTEARKELLEQWTKEWAQFVDALASGRI